MMRGKILKSTFDEKNCSSCVRKQTKYGIFENTVVCDEEDLPYANRWDGWYLAEYRCDLDSLKEKNKLMQQRLIGMKQILSLLDNPPKEVSDFIFSIEQQIHLDKKKYNRLSEYYEKLSVSLVNDRKRLAEALEKKKQNQQK